jgi:flavin reductase (DIM6/NTAB) family NADH-FMN oxidoreductase RutF
MIGVALGKGHHTNEGIRDHKEFSINIPGVDLIKAVDYVGLVSGAKTDKSKIFESFQGQLKYAPMIRYCPVNLECKAVTKVDFPSNEFFVGDDQVPTEWVNVNCFSIKNQATYKLRP